MADPLTTNKLLAQPTRGSDVDTWGPTLNNNYQIIDNSFGGTATIALTSSPVTLLSSQYQCVFLHLTGALNANVAVTLPAIGSFYTIINDTTNSSAFYVTLQTTAAGGLAIGLPPATTDIMTDGANIKFRNLPYAGTYWYHSGSSTPAWVSACTTPPWLYCDGTAFSSATYPALATILNSATLPDLRGRTAFYLDGGTGRLTGGTSVGISSGAQTITLDQAHLPNINFTVTDPGHTHTVTANNAHTGNRLSGGGGNHGGGLTAGTMTLSTEFTGITVASGGSGTPFTIMPPSAVAGITMVRAA